MPGIDETGREFEGSLWSNFFFKAGDTENVQNSNQHCTMKVWKFLSS